MINFLYVLVFNIAIVVIYDRVSNDTVIIIDAIKIF